MMKKFIALMLMVSAVGASAASHSFVSLLSGPTIIAITNNGVATPTVLNTTVSTTTLGGGGALTPLIVYTNYKGFGFTTNITGYGYLANTNWWYYYTNTVAGDTTDSGWRTNFTGINNGGPFVDVPVWSDANGDAADLTWSLTYSKTGTATHGTNSAVFSLWKSYDGVNFESSTLADIRIESTVTASQQTVSTNLSANFLQGVKVIRLRGVTFAAAQTNSISTFTLYSSGISGFRP